MFGHAQDPDEKNRISFRAGDIESPHENTCNRPIWAILPMSHWEFQIHLQHGGTQNIQLQVLLVTVVSKSKPKWKL